LARAAADALSLERVLWVPSYKPPHKQDRTLSPFRHRVAMTELTARRDRRFDVSQIEATLPGDSFTVKTLAHLAKALPEMVLFFIVGADVLPELRDWFKPERISRWATLACGVRPGYKRPDKKDLPVDRVVYFESPEVDIASRTIRDRVRAGESVQGQVTPDVDRYIREHGLYP
jgi:nicotinate-nucleotide adenylyltransferase